MSESDEVTIRIMQDIHIDGIIVLIPPRFYMNPKIAEGIKKAILLAQERDSGE